MVYIEYKIRRNLWENTDLGLYSRDRCDIIGDI